MSGSDRGDRGALVALAIVVAAIVIIFLVEELGGPYSQAVEQPATQYNNTQGNQNDPVYFGFLKLPDTIAQWFAAIASVASIFVSVWAVKLVGRTLQETRRTADAATEANNTTREIGEAQVRAYVTVESCSFDFSKPDKGDIGVLHVGYTNTGQSPAFNLMVNFGLRFIRRGNPNFPTAGSPPMHYCPITSRVVTTVAPKFVGNLDLEIPRSSFPSEWLQYISTGQVLIMLDGTIQWTDVFKKTETVRIVGLENTPRDYFTKAPPVGGFAVSNMRQEKTTDKP